MYPGLEKQLTHLRRVAVAISLCVLATGLAAGCAHSHPVGSADNQSLQGTIKHVPQGQWLPIHTKGNALVGIGTYSLPQKIVFPAGLAPMPLGLVFVHPNHPDRVVKIAVQVFFEPTDEKTVFDWAHRGTLTSDSEPGYWSHKHESYLVPATGRQPNGRAASGYVWSFHSPSEMPVSWRIFGGFDTKNWFYSVRWSGMPTITEADLKKEPAGGLPWDAVSPVGENAGDFGPNSPVVGQKIIVSLLVIYETQPQVQWLPIHFSNQRIAAVGQHVLRHPVTLPAELKPLAKAQAYFRDGPDQDLLGFVIYFPAAQEKAVMKWAQSYPVILEGGSGAAWADKSHFFMTGRESPVMDHLVSCPADSPDLLAWHIGGLLKVAPDAYGIAWSGVAVVTPADFQTNSMAQILVNDAAADYTGPGSYFGPDSPLKGEKRHIKVSIKF